MGGGETYEKGESESFWTAFLDVYGIDQRCASGRRTPTGSRDIVNSPFPWPDGVTEAERGQVERPAQAVLDARARFSTSTLADLYDPVAMPPALVRAHGELDRAVDRLYRGEAFGSDLEGVELLFGEYGRLTTVQGSEATPVRT